MPQICFNYDYPSCLDSCAGHNELKAGEQVKLTLIPKDPLWPAQIVADVTEVLAGNLAKDGYGRRYTFCFDEALLNGGATIADCDFADTPSCYGCCDKLDERVTFLEEGGADTFATPTEGTSQGTNGVTYADGSQQCNVACPPEGTPEGAVSQVGPDGTVVWLVPTDQNLVNFVSTEAYNPLAPAFPTDYTASANGKDEEDGDTIAVQSPNGYVTVWTWVGGVASNPVVVEDPDTVSPLSITVGGDGSQQISYTDENGNIENFSIPAPSTDTNTTSDFGLVINPDDSVTITHDAGDGTGPQVFTIPAAIGSISTVTNVLNQDGSVTSTHDNGTTQVSWTTPAPVPFVEQTWEDGAGTHITTGVNHNESEQASRSGDTRIGDTDPNSGQYKLQVIGDEEVFGQLKITDPDRTSGDGDNFRFPNSNLEIRSDGASQQTHVSETSFNRMDWYSGYMPEGQRAWSMRNILQDGVPQFYLEPALDNGSTLFPAGDRRLQHGWSMDKQSNFMVGNRFTTQTNGSNMILTQDVSGQHVDEHLGGASNANQAVRPSVIQNGVVGILAQSTDTGSSQSSGSSELWGFAAGGSVNTFTQLTFWGAAWTQILNAADVATGKFYSRNLAPNGCWQPLYHFHCAQSGYGRIQVTSTDYITYDLADDSGDFEMFRADIETNADPVSLGTGNATLITSYQEQYLGAFGGI